MSHWNVASETDQMHYFILIILSYLNSPMWLDSILLVQLWTLLPLQEELKYTIGQEEELRKFSSANFCHPAFIAASVYHDCKKKKKVTVNQLG